MLSPSFHRLAKGLVTAWLVLPVAAPLVLSLPAALVRLTAAYLP